MKVCGLAISAVRVVAAILGLAMASGCAARASGQVTEEMKGRVGAGSRLSLG